MPQQNSTMNCSKYIHQTTYLGTTKVQQFVLQTTCIAVHININMDKSLFLSEYKCHFNKKKEIESI